MVSRALAGPSTELPTANTATVWLKSVSDKRGPVFTTVHASNLSTVIHRGSTAGW